MELHKILQSQLKRLNLTELHAPTSVEQWQEFVDQVNKVYHENDAERYLIERSMELSSREINELNERIENAQHIAGIGYWHYDAKHDVITWSNEIRRVLNFSNDAVIPNYAHILEMVHPEDRKNLDDSIKLTIKSGKKYELNVRMQPQGTDKYIWLRVVGAPYHCDSAPFLQLSGICIDITKRIETEQQLKKLNQELIDSARRVGMADVAVSILHNVGNVLNSANVSIALLNENNEQEHFKHFIDICQLLVDHTDNINEFLTTDKSGLLIPAYLMQLSKVISKAYNTETIELKNLTEKVQHIRDIVIAQQVLSKSGEIMELVSLEEELESALRMVISPLNENGVKIEKQYEPTAKITINRGKLLQILVNMIQNAKDALIYDNDKSKDKLITLIIKNATPNNNIEISVLDNGVGISTENLSKIFTYGFTTKSFGHGIGMHSSLIAAKELGANINVFSEGVGKGAMLTLQIPTQEKQHG